MWHKSEQSPVIITYKAETCSPPRILVLLLNLHSWFNVVLILERDYKEHTFVTLFYVIHFYVLVHVVPFS
jgi:hypothetical protein